MLELNLDAFFRVTPGLRDDPAHRDRFWSDVDAVMGPILLHDHAGEAGAPLRSAAGERASAPWRLGGEPTRWGLIEIAFEGPSDGNPFVDVDLTVRLTCGERTWT